MGCLPRRRRVVADGDEPVDGSRCVQTPHRSHPKNRRSRHAGMRWLLDSSITIHVLNGWARPIIIEVPPCRHDHHQETKATDEQTDSPTTARPFASCVGFTGHHHRGPLAARLAPRDHCCAQEKLDRSQRQIASAGARSGFTTPEPGFLGGVSPAKRASQRYHYPSS